MYKSSGVLVAAVAALLVSGCASVAEEEAPAPETTGTVSSEVRVAAPRASTASNIAMTSLATGKCMDVAFGNGVEGTPVNQFDCNYRPSQLFSIRHINNTLHDFQIVYNRAPTMCVGLSIVTGANGSNLLSLRRCQDGNGVIPRWVSWRWVDAEDYLPNLGISTIISVSDSKCIDVPGAVATNSLQLQTSQCHGNANQRWLIFARP